MKCYFNQNIFRPGVKITKFDLNATAPRLSVIAADLINKSNNQDRSDRLDLKKSYKQHRYPFDIFDIDESTSRGHDNLLPKYIKDQVVYIPFPHRKIKKVIGLEGFHFKLSDFYYKGICLQNCRTCPHTNKELFRINDIVSQLEIYFCQNNVKKDKNLTRMMDKDGYILFEDLYRLRYVRTINPSIEELRIGLTHSYVLQMDLNQTKVKLKFPPSVWPTLNNFEPIGIDYGDTAPLMVPEIFKSSLIYNSCFQRICEEYNNRIEKLLYKSIPNYYNYFIEYRPNKRDFTNFDSNYIQLYNYV